jgi:hypothetical protein
MSSSPTFVNKIKKTQTYWESPLLLATKKDINDSIE